MTWILADVGGTNLRFAASDDLQALRDVQRFENDSFTCFDAGLAAYLSTIGADRVTGLCVAIAGPVSGEAARLTNRDWRFDVGRLAAAHGGARVHLINDLSALGYALALLDSDGVESLTPGTAPAQDHEQRLVLGIGTGLNVSPVTTHAGIVTCARAEAGLGSPPARVLAPMLEYLGARPDWAICVEDVVSGPALGRLHGAATGAVDVTGRTVAQAAAAGDAQALSSLQVFSRMVGALVLDLRLLFMPTQGIYLAGSVVRGLVDSPVRDGLIAACSAAPTPKSVLPDVPLAVITQDEAALLGCLAYARAEG